MRLRDIMMMLVAVAVALASAGEAGAQRRDGGGWWPWGKKQADWELLGTETVDFRGERDIIRVGREDGRFRALRLRVRNNDVHVMDLKVVYGNGESDHLTIDRVIRAESDTGPLDLKGEARFIKEIQLTYRARPDRRGGHAVVEMFGLHDPRGGAVAAPPPGRDRDREHGRQGQDRQWELLGQRNVEFQNDRDVIPVGRQEGRFSKIRLKVQCHDIDLLAMRVVYSNGQEDECRIDRRVRDEEESVTVDLRGAR